MNVLIVGAGALGKSIAGLVADYASVTVYERNFVTHQMFLKNGFVLKEASGRKNVNVRSVGSLEELRGEKIDILIFATKVMDLRAAVVEASGLDPRCVLFPQNGIFDVSWVKRFFKSARICRCVTTMACQETGSGEAVLFYRGNMYVGGDGAIKIAGFFRKCGIKTSAYRDSNGFIWAKLIFSAAMNPLPVITRRGYDVLKKDSEIWKLVRDAIEEGRAVAKVLGVRLAFDPMRLIHRVRSGDLTGIKHRGSIIHDMSVGRSTELDFITGALIRQARKLGVKTPALNLILARAKAAGA